MRMYVFTVSLRQVEKKVGRVEKKSCVHCLGEISVQLPSGRAQRNLVIDYKLAQPRVGSNVKNVVKLAVKNTQL